MPRTKRAHGRCEVSRQSVTAMSSTHPDRFTPSGFFALRTPLLPFDELLAWGEGLEAPRAPLPPAPSPPGGEGRMRGAGGDPARLEQALAADRLRLRARLRAVV